ncbi:hypothetical protein BDV12DRAFT_205922 [Aspergillus spectabilis]
MAEKESLLRADVSESGDIPVADWAKLKVTPNDCTIAQPPGACPEPSRQAYSDKLKIAVLNATGACSAGTGCIAQRFDHFQSGDFTPNGNHIVVTLEFIGAPAAPHPASIYRGEQVILLKTDNTTFSNGDPWKCLSCGVPASNPQYTKPQKDYPHVTRSGTRALLGQSILQCGGQLLTSDECTPDNSYIYPIYWPISADGSAPGGTLRELRLHPDDEHVGGDVLTPRYDLVNVSMLIQPNGSAPIMASVDTLELHPKAITVGELRGFRGSGDEILYIGYPYEANNIDIFAVHLVTGAVRRLTSHPEYIDLISFSADNQWVVGMDTRGSNRQMWMSGMRMVPPVVDLVTVTAAASIRNNRHRRFFQPILLDRYGDRGDYVGQQVNAAGDGSNSSINDPNWNGRADPAFSPDGTKIVYSQSLVTYPACGGDNPLPCAESTADRGRTYRVMLAHLTSRKPSTPAPVFKVPESVPWAMLFPPDAALPEPYTLEPRNIHPSGQIQRSCTLTIPEDNPWMNHLDWYSDLTQTGAVHASKNTSLDGFHMCIDEMKNIFMANGTLTTTIDGVVYAQPANGT